MSGEDCCCSCKFWRQRQELQPDVFWLGGKPSYKTFKECRFNPPMSDGWPRTEADDWCGSFIRREERKTLASVTFPPMTWLTLCKLYADGLPWDKQLGPPPDEQGTRVPAEIWEEAKKGQK
jgi:hypothetical protein